MGGNEVFFGALALVLGVVVAVVIVVVARRDALATRARADAEARRVRTEVAELERRAAGLRGRLADADERDARAEAELRARRAADEARLTARLEEVAHLTAEEARARLLERMRPGAEREAALLRRRLERSARDSAEETAARVVASAIQRLAGPSSSQLVVTRVQLPSEEMKGRIIGKEGRNIRTFEALTGVNVIIDETPDAVLLSSFDAERREIAAVALESLLADGRIHPGRIEAAYAEAVAGAEKRRRMAGEQAAHDAGVGGLHPDLVMTLGSLRLRTSYGQNVLAHLVESAQIAAMLATDLGADVVIARRAAFLHDIGKAAPAEQPGTHALIGAEMARRAGESEAVVHAIAAHHEEVPPASVEAVLVIAADAASAARVGARREEVDAFVERMESLEGVAVAHPGVRKALAMAAGRELRVIVEPTQVADEALPDLAAAIARNLESDVHYPGEVKVVVVKELRASATAC
jgi:ribonuclease Y